MQARVYFDAGWVSSAVRKSRGPIQLDGVRTKRSMIRVLRLRLPRRFQQLRAIAAEALRTISKHSASWLHRSPERGWNSTRRSASECANVVARFSQEWRN